MLPKEPSATTSLTSSTNKGPEGKRKAQPKAQMDTPVQFVKGVGPRLGAIFANRDIHTLKDLLTFFPRAYEDRTRLLKVSELKDGEQATVPVRVLEARRIPVRSSNRSIFEVRCCDDSGTLSLKWFHAPRGMEARFTPGAQIIVTGTVKVFMGRPGIVHPEVTWGLSLTPDVGRVVPVYTEIEGVPSRTLRKILWEALEKFSNTITEDLPERFLRKHGLPLATEAIRTIHFPPEGPTQSADAIKNLVEFNTPAHWRLIYEEFFKFEYLILRQRLRMQKEVGPAFGKKGGIAALSDLRKGLPFELTEGQSRTIDEILKDFSEPHPMNRLAQGDVGSGKTVVGFLTAGCVLAEGGQAALMAPTEILAEQHYKNAIKLFGGRLNVALLTGKTPTSERNIILGRLKSGEPILLIGTHALLEDPVIFQNLAYILIDEQHRFGVEQRRILRRKGIHTDPKTGVTLHPHSILLTATPIPRTLALTAYGDLSVSTIRELPPGRSPIRTHIVRGSNRVHAYERIRRELRAGHQAYFIYPLVNDSEAEGFTALKSAVAEADLLAREVFPDFKVGLLHGQQRPEDKSATMERFQRGEIHILVSTTVVEVGVDVPNATIMAVEHAERFGLSQLHQLRGRVGRGTSQSYCFLFANNYTGETTAQRLEVLEQTTDGFKIAEADLEIRGPGEFLGTRQAGGLPFRMAHLVRDQAWLFKARDDASLLLKEDSELSMPQHLPLRKYYEREGSLQFERLKTS